MVFWIIKQHSDIDTLPPCCTTFQNLNLVATWSLESASVWNLENQNHIIVWFSFWQARPIFKWSWQFHHLNARILLVDWPSFSIRFLEVSFKPAVFQDLESRNMFHSCFFFFSVTFVHHFRNLPSGCSHRRRQLLVNRLDSENWDMPTCHDRRQRAKKLAEVLGQCCKTTAKRHLRFESIRWFCDFCEFCELMQIPILANTVTWDDTGKF